MSIRRKENNMKLRTLAVALALAVASQMSLADDKTTGKDVGKKVEDAGKAIGSYSVAQRDEAVKSARAALKETDADLNRLEKKVGAEWDKMDATARKKARATIDALRKQRNETAEWLKKLEKSSAQAWDEVKGGFVKSYNSMKQSFAKASKEL
jgi:Skp family chaperone for outer membrane proteins